MRQRAHSLEQTGPISAQTVWVPGSLFARVPSQAERVQDWHSLDRQEDIRVNLEITL